MRKRLTILLMISSVSFAGNANLKKSKKKYYMDSDQKPSKNQEDVDWLPEGFENLNFEKPLLPPIPDHLKDKLSPLAPTAENIETENAPTSEESVTVEDDPTLIENKEPIVTIQAKIEDPFGLKPIEEYLDQAALSALNNDRDPAYIRYLFGKVLSRKVRKFFYEKNIQSERQLLAFYLTIGTFTEDVFGVKSIYSTIAVQAAKDLTKEENHNSPGINKPWHDASEKISTTLPAPFKPIYEAARKRILDDYKKVDKPHNQTVPYKLAYATLSKYWNKESCVRDIFLASARLTELRAFYIMIDSAERWLEEAYYIAIKEISVHHSAENPFRNTEEWIRFRSEHFDNLPANEYIYLKPWLDLLNGETHSESSDESEERKFKEYLSTLTIEIAK